MLILNEASLKEVINKMRQVYEHNKETDLLKKINVSMENFRGNIIIDEEEAYEEDRYRSIEIRQREDLVSASALGNSQSSHLEEESKKSDHQKEV